MPPLLLFIYRSGVAQPGFATAPVHATVKAGNNGKRMLHFPKLTAGGPYTLKIMEQGKPHTAIGLKGILIGDVWVTPGQSNIYQYGCVPGKELPKNKTGCQR